MFRLQTSFGFLLWGLAPLLALGAGPAGAEAGWLGFRNDLMVPVVVQGGSVVNNVVRPGKAHLLFPGEVSWDCVLQPGVRIITIADPKQRGRVLFQGPVRCAGKDLFFSVQFDPTPPPRAVLLPAKLPPSGPGRTPR